jgi:predicted phage terminase large subunit-like protein
MSSSNERRSSPQSSRARRIQRVASRLPSLAEIRAEKARRHLADFARQAWEIVEPAVPLVWNWHIDAICDHLEAVRRGQISNLLINVPPGSMKSLLTCVFWPAWIWATEPSWRGIFATYVDVLAWRDSIRTRDIVKNDWFQRHFVRGDWALSHDQDTKTLFSNTRQGFRLATTVGGGGTGLRGDAVVIDDPLKVQDAFSEAKREEAKRYRRQVMSNRFVDMRRARRVMIMQRLHEDDPAGDVLREGGYVHLNVPAEYERESHCTTAIGYEDPRTEEGESFFKELFPPTVLADEKRTKGSAGYAGQYQQRPAPASGNIFHRDWWQKTTLAVIKAMQFDEIVLSIDCAFKGKATSDRVAILVLGRKGADVYVLDLVVDQMGFGATKAAVRASVAKHPKARAKYVEDKANGSAIIDELKHEIPGLIAVEPDGGKEARAHAAAPYVEAGNCWVPVDAPWAQEFVEEHAAFPFGTYDDIVDAFTQGARRLFGGDDPVARIKALSKGLGGLMGRMR